MYPSLGDTQANIFQVFLMTTKLKHKDYKQ